MRQDRHGFTLIELLVVVAIIAILAAIAVPNFLEAQVRAKVVRTQADLRSVAMALEAYFVEANHYPPNDGLYNVIPIQLSTPVAYFSNTNLVDPFTDKKVDPVYGDLARYYTYAQIVSHQEMLRIYRKDRAHMPPVEGVDSPYYNPGALRKYGAWRLVGYGPDRNYDDPAFIFGSDPSDPTGVVKGSDTLYDPSNGTTSKGNILRLQKGYNKAR